jgi:CHRD domain
MMQRGWMAAIAGAALLVGACSAGGEKAPASQGMAESAAQAPTSPTFSATLSGANEVPAVTSKASGTATFTQTSDSTIDFTITVDSIQDVVAAHLHKGAAGQDGPPVVPLFSGAFSGSGTLVSGTIKASDVQGMSIADLVAAIKADSIYVNVHTKGNPGGELRGQVTAQ